MGIANTMPRINLLFCIYIYLSIYFFRCLFLCLSPPYHQLKPGHIAHDDCNSNNIMRTILAQTLQPSHNYAHRLKSIFSLNSFGNLYIFFSIIDRLFPMITKYKFHLIKNTENFSIFFPSWNGNICLMQSN